MFQIKSYLQYKNTPDGKPRVLTEGVDYHHTTEDGLWDFHTKQKGFYGVASLEDCRPILSVKNMLKDSELWSEGDIAVDKGMLKIVFMIEENGVYKMVGRQSNELWNDEDESFLYNCEKLGSFFDDPAKYSKLLWDCSEEEGWEKVLELLNIEL